MDVKTRLAEIERIKKLVEKAAARDYRLNDFGFSDITTLLEIIAAYQEDLKHEQNKNISKDLEAMANVLDPVVDDRNQDWD